MEENTYYTAAMTSDENDGEIYGEIYHVRLHIPPEEVTRIFAASDLLTRVWVENPGLGIEALKLSSTAEFGRLELEDDVMMGEIDGGEDLVPAEDGWWPELWTQTRTFADRVLIAPSGVEWQAIIEDTNVHAWTDVGWASFEIFVLRYGLVELKATDDAKYLTAGIIKKGDVPALPVLADALDEAGNPPWIGNRLREVVKNFGSDAYTLEGADQIIYGSALRKLSGGVTKPKARRPRGKRKK